MGYQYKLTDAFYDFEALKNISTLAIFRPAAKQIIIGINTYFTSNQPDEIPDLTPLFNEPGIYDRLRQRIVEVNQDDLDDFGITDYQNQIVFTSLDQTVNALYHMSNHPENLVIGFNTKHYDVALLASLYADYTVWYKHDRSIDFLPQTTALRALSDEIIVGRKSPWKLFDYRSLKSETYRHLQNSQSFIDMKELNEGTMGMAALKRLVAQGGHRIQTSPLLKDGAPPLDSFDALADFLAYNVSDNFGALNVFENEAYQDPFFLKTQLLKRYEATRFKGKYLKRDSTSAKFIESLISPDQVLVDDEVVSFGYPITRNYLLTLVNHYIAQQISTDWKPFSDIRDYYQYLHKNYIDKLNVTPLSDDELKQQLIQKLEQAPSDIQTIFLFNQGFIGPNGEILRELFEIKNGQIYFPLDTFDGLQQYYEELKEQTILYHQTECHNYNVNERLLQNENRENEYMNRFIYEKLRNYSNKHLIKWIAFYPTGRQRIVVKDRALMVDLLEYLEHHYEFGDKNTCMTPYGSIGYVYYRAFRGKNLKNKDDRKEAVKNDPFLQELGLNKKNGVPIILPNGCPAYSLLSIGGIHGNLIDLNTYLTQLYRHRQLVSAQKKLREFYQPIIESQSLDAWIYYFENQFIHDLKNKESRSDLTEKQQQTLDKQLNTIRKNYEKDSLSIAALLINRLPITGYIYNEPDDIQKIIETYQNDLITGSKKSGNFKRIPAAKEPNHKSFTLTLDADNVVHADIASYYPNLIKILKIFLNDGEDFYSNMLEERLKLKSLLPEDKSTWTSEDFFNDILQTLNKLMLNAASGQADAGYDNNIRLNNRIMRMRACGQLILTALTLDIAQAGGIPNSINTDGVYINKMTLDEANDQLERWTSLFQLEAEGEIMTRFYSKDSNNRVEIVNDFVVGAGGGTVGSYKGVSLKKALSKPQISDASLVEYFRTTRHALRSFDREKIRQYMRQRIEETLKNPYETNEKKFKNKHTALGNLYLSFQYIANSNPNKNRFIISQDGRTGKSIYQSPINRYFYVTDDILYSDPEIFSREFITNLEMIICSKEVKENNPDAIQKLKEAGVYDGLKLEPGTHIGFYKLQNTEPDQFFYMQNQSVSKIPIELIPYLDLDAYIDIVKNQWNNWSENFIEDYALNESISGGVTV